MAKKILVCSDRDGTINVDNDYYLGKSPNWKSQIEFLPGVIRGIKLLNKIPNLEFFIITNQSGVAISYDKKDSEFANLTEERMHEVNHEIITQLAGNGASVRSYFACPFVDSAYAKSALVKGRTINSKYLHDNHPNIKPAIGMIEKAAKSIISKLSDCDIWMIGNRFSDVQTGINANGRSILIERNSRPEDITQAFAAAEIFPDRIFLAFNFYRAAKKIAETYQT